MDEVNDSMKVQFIKLDLSEIYDVNGNSKWVLSGVMRDNVKQASFTCTIPGWAIDGLAMEAEWTDPYPLRRLDFGGIG